MNTRSELELIRSILEKVSTTLSAEKVLGFALEGIQKSLNCVAAAIVLVDPKARSFRVVNSKGWGYEFIKRFHSGPYHGLVEEMGKNWQPILINEQDSRKGMDGYVFQGDCNTLLALPLTIRSKPVGFLYLSWCDDADVDEEVRTVVTDMSRLCTLILDHGSLDDKVFSMSNIDPLTGLYSYKYWHEALHQETKRAEKLDSSIAMMLINLNRFKELNAMLGHTKGDEHLVEVSDIINNELSSLDVPSRVGGKWSVLLVGDDLDAAKDVADRIIDSFKSLTSPGSSVTNLSIGLSMYNPGEEEKALIERVNGALLEARRLGPNSCRIV